MVARYLDCGIFERGFARILCPDCATEYLLAFSCKGRGLCPSCGAKRAAEFAAFLQDEVVADIGHAQWVFSSVSLPPRRLVEGIALSFPTAATGRYAPPGSTRYP